MSISGHVTQVQEKRSRIEIYLDVLDAIQNGKHLRTVIMYRSNISWTPLIRILRLLSEGLIINRSKTGRPFYELTDKGREVLHKFSNVVEWKRKIES